MRIPTERIELGDGEWVEIQKYLTRGQRRAIDKHTQREAVQLMGLFRGALDTDEMMARAEDSGEERIADPRNPDEEDMWLWHCITGWSFGEEKPTAEEIDELPDEVTEAIIARMRELYVRTEEQDRNLDGTRQLGPTVTEVSTVN